MPQSQSKSNVPGLDPSGRCLARLSSRSALLTDFRLLLDRGGAVQPETIRPMVLQENVLARGSTAARAKLFKELKGRYLLDQSNPLFRHFLQEWRRTESHEEESLLIYVLLCLNDRTVTVTSINWLFPRLREQDSDLRIDDLEVFYRRIGGGPQPEISGWTISTLNRVARHYLASVRDAGLAKGAVRKSAVRPALYAAPVRLLIRGLELAGVSTSDVVRHESFKILGIGPGEITDALSELHRQRALTFRQQADVIELVL